MDIVTAERALTRLVAQRSGLEIDREVLCGGGTVPETPPLARVRFMSGKVSGAALAEFVAEVRGVFAEPEEARAFAAAVWGHLPRYGEAGFTELSGDDKTGIEFAEQNGCFTATGRIRAYFA